MIGILRLMTLVFLVISLVNTALFALRPQTPHSMLGFIRYLPRSSQLILRDIDRSQLYRLFETGARYIVNWKPLSDDRWIYYTGNNGSFLVDILSNLGSVSLSDDRDFSLWSPDGNFVLFSVSHEEQELWTLESNGNFRTHHFQISYWSTEILWAPDNGIIYMLLPIMPFEQNGSRQIIYTSLDCIQKEPDCSVTWLELPQTTPLIGKLLGWLPDGKTMLVAGYHGEFRGQNTVFGINVVTRSTNQIVENLLFGTIPVSSPDGKVLAASLALPANDLPSAQSELIPALYLIDLATGERKLLWAGIAGQLGWSPEGDYLAFELVSRVGNDRSIWLYERSTGDVYTVTEPGIQEGSPAWVRYQGRPFEGVLMVALDAALVALLWLTGRKENKKGDL